MGRQSEFFYESFEEDPTASQFRAHTGTKSKGYVSLDGVPATYYSKTWMKQDLHNQHYRASAWIYFNPDSPAPPNPTLECKVDGVTHAAAASFADQRAGDWFLVNLDITNLPANYNNLTIEVVTDGITGGEVYVDDFRFHPLQGTMNTYLYNEWGEVTHIFDVNNLYTEYEYDSEGRLMAIYKDRIGPGKIKLSEQEINYQKTF